MIIAQQSRPDLGSFTILISENLFCEALDHMDVELSKVSARVDAAFPTSVISRVDLPTETARAT